MLCGPTHTPASVWEMVPYDFGDNHVLEQIIFLGYNVHTMKLGRGRCLLYDEERQFSAKVMTIVNLNCDSGSLLAR